MSLRKQIHILVDGSFRMHVEIDEKKTAMEKVYKFLLHLAKKGDEQPSYMDRVHIHVGETYIRLEEGQAEKSLLDAKDVIFENTTQNDTLSAWKTALACDKTEKHVYFILSSVIDKELLSVFENGEQKLLFMDFSGQSTEIPYEDRMRVQVIKTKDIKKAANLFHRRFLNEYLTTVNAGFSMKAEFINSTLEDSTELDLDMIDVFGMTTYEPIEGIPILTTSFIMPVEHCYDEKGAKVDSSYGYQVLKELLTPEDDYVSLDDDASKDTTLDESLVENPDDSKDESKNMETDESKNEETAESESNMKKKIKVEATEDAPEAEVVPVEEDEESESKSLKRSPRKKKSKFASLAEDDDDDEEYMPNKKKNAKKNTKSPAKGSKRKHVKEEEEEEPIPPKRSLRSRRTTRGRKSETEVKEEEPEEVMEEPPVLEREEPTEQNYQDEQPTENEEQTQEPEKTEGAGEEKKEEEKKEEEKPEEPKLPLWLIARGKDRKTGIYRPVILRLRGLEDDDKTYYDEETLKQKEEEAAKKKLEEEAEEAKKKCEEEVVSQQTEHEKAMLQQEMLQLQMQQQQQQQQILQQQQETTGVVMEEDSPESPPPFDCPASPDMEPVVSHAVKIIPTTVMEIPLEPQSSQPSSSSDSDYRKVTPVKSIPLEPVQTGGDVDYRKTEDTAIEPGELTEPGELADSDLDDGEIGELVDEVGEGPDENDGSELGELVDEIIGSEPLEPESEDRMQDIIDDDDANVPEEPEELDMLPVQQEPVKTIPIESCIETEESVKTIDETDTSENPTGEGNKIEEKKSEGDKYIQVVVLDMTWDQFLDSAVMMDDEEAFEEITEREKEVVGEPPFHDYSELTGWYTDEAMQFYINKMFRALRKLQDRSHLFEMEYRNMTQMIVYGQNPELARAFAMLMVDDMEAFPEQSIPFAEAASRHFESLYHHMLPFKPRRKIPEPSRHHHYQQHPRSHHQGHHGYQGHQGYHGHSGHSNYHMHQGHQGHHQGHYQSHQNHPNQHRYQQRTPQKHHNQNYSHHARY